VTGYTPDKAERPVPHPFDYVTRDQIQDLWGIGFTIVKRSRHPDPFHVPPEMIPQGRAYQWMHLIHDKVYTDGPGWAPVPASRHDGYFMPFGHFGPIEVNGLGLFEKPKFEVDQERAAQIAAAKKQTDDWIRQTGIDGISGSVSVGAIGMEVGKGEKVFKNTSSKSINTTVGVPADMFPYMAEVFAERDRLYADLEAEWRAEGGSYTDQQNRVMMQYEAAIGEDPNIPKGPTLNALLLPYAVENVRAKLKEGKTDE
jgi:hypothetical protein